jgi:hypothetical protein
MKDRLIDAIKGAVELNLRYSSVVLNLSKDYIRDFEQLVRKGVQRGDAPSDGVDKPAAVRRAPILLVGERGEIATGAFVLNNTANAELNVSLVVQGELEPGQVEVVPATLVLPPSGNAYVRLKVPLSDAMSEDRDYVGAVVAPGLSAQAIEFVVRRLPGGGASKPPRKRMTKRKAAH